MTREEPVPRSESSEINESDVENKDRHQFHLKIVNLTNAKAEVFPIQKPYDGAG
jgi:hypothetical protein